MIFIFDFDHEWYNAFSNLKYFKLSNLSVKYNWLYRINQETNQHALTLPIPLTKNKFASEQLWEKSMLTIENLFTDRVFDKFFEQGWIKSNRNILKLENNQKAYFIKENKIDEKIKFSNFIKWLDKDEFSEFEPLFDAINYIID